MTRSNSTITRPLYAAVGAGEFAVAELRKGAAELSAQAAALQKQAAALSEEASKRAQTLPDRARGVDVEQIRELVRSSLVEAQHKVGEAYVELAERGEKLVGSIRRQQATQQLEAQAGQTARSTKATVTSAKKGAERTKTSAKATTTSAKKTADAAGKAASDAADKIG
jgi:heparin binding hemagglutinin HbhA